MAQAESREEFKKKKTPLNPNLSLSFVGARKAQTCAPCMSWDSKPREEKAIRQVIALGRLVQQTEWALRNTVSSRQQEMPTGKRAAPTMCFIISNPHSAVILTVNRAQIKATDSEL